MEILNGLNRVYYMLIAAALGITLVSASASSPTVMQQVTTLTASLCGIVASLRAVIGVLALLLFIAGGTMYAGAHMLPAAGNLRGNLQGWSMGMIMGGVVGIILVLIAPYILNMIIGIGGGAASGIVTCSP
jgi:type IV secretory pathway VirB2 component (pilin)